MKAIGAKMKKEEVWSFDEREVKESVLLAMPEDTTLRFFHVTSGDSGKQYETYLLHVKHLRTTIAWCNCSNGWYDRLPLLMADLCRKRPIIVSDQMCKHAMRLIEFLRAEDERERRS